MDKKKSAFIAIVGRPNVGKSSILNMLLGAKIAAVSNKPQTTRTRIMGVLTEDDTQLVFIDTPGLHRPKNKLGEYMVGAVHEGMRDVDGCILVTQVSDRLSPAESELLLRLKAGKPKTVLAVNKIDLLPDKKEILSCIGLWKDEYDFESVFPVSAKTGDGMPELKKELLRLARPSVHYYDEDALTDQPDRVIAAEMIREKLLMLLDKEVPHGLAVGIERFAERTGNSGALLDIECVIYCEKESHKGIIIGKGGALLKKASSAARFELERFFDCKVNLQCWVKVKSDWRNRPGIIHNFGLD